jgi:exosome complex protein LRP1
MDTTDLHPMLNNLSEHIDDLEASLEPLLKSTLPDISSRLPLLDKAKLHVFTASAIESLLYCTPYTSTHKSHTNKPQPRFN